MHIIWILSSDYFYFYFYFIFFIFFFYFIFIIIIYLFIFIFFFFFCNLNLAIFGHFDNKTEWTVGTLCMQLFLQFHANSFKTLRVLSVWSEDMHVVWI